MQNQTSQFSIPSYLKNSNSPTLNSLQPYHHNPSSMHQNIPQFWSPGYNTMGLQHPYVTQIPQYNYANQYVPAYN